MNQEAVFALRFVVKDLAKMRKGIEQMNKNIKNMQKNANNASKGVEKVNSSFNKAAKSALKFAAAYFTVSKIISTVFSKANEALQLNEMAISAGIAADKIGKLGKVLKRYGGDARSAGAAYASLTNIIGGAQHGMGISEDVARVNAMFGIGFNYGNVSQDQLMTQIAMAMHRLKQNNDSWGINQIASAYGLSSDVAAMLATHGANWKNVVSAEEFEKMNMSEAQRLIKAQEDLEESLRSAVMKLAPVLTELVNAINDLLDWLKRKFGGEKPNIATLTNEGFVKKSSNGYMTYNKDNNNYIVTDKILNTLYQGNNPLLADMAYQNQNYKPSWWDKSVVKPFWNWLGVETPAIDRGLERQQANVNLTIVDKTHNGIKVENKFGNTEGVPVAIR